MLIQRISLKGINKYDIRLKIESKNNNRRNFIKKAAMAGLLAVSIPEIVVQFGAAFISYQKIYNEAQKHAPGVYWTGDGVHPTLAGAQLMAQAWLATV